MRSLEWVLIQCPYKGKSGHGETPRKSIMWRWRQRLWNKFFKALRRNEPCQHLDLGLDLPEIRGNTFLLFKSPDLWYFLMAAQAPRTRHDDHTVTMVGTHWAGAEWFSRGGTPLWCLEIGIRYLCSRVVIISACFSMIKSWGSKILFLGALYEA